MKQSNKMVNEMRQRPQLFYRTNTIHYAILVETTCLSVAITSLFTVFKEYSLTFRAWLPYDHHSSPILFYFTYVHQLIGFILGSILHLACDGVICGLLMHIYGQLEILESRLRRIAHEPDIIRDCILQHDRIYKLVYISNLVLSREISTATLIRRTKVS